MTASKKRVVIGNTALGAAGTAVATLVVWGLGQLGADIETAGGAAAIGGAVAGTTIFVVRYGLTGLAHVVWAGSDENGGAPPPELPRDPAKRKGA
jgi:hypothetical protein